ncbi:Transaldolase / Glucose-6-phosphate isomerase [hydrothermal vent metagenome]|uniref:Transaldolase / Glucose-6-phosphate isomerase n=1 Tax=hydrothermal vent metagenome TaxID=652676 RepID=A0A3B1C892_9ZZZZ
MNPVKQLEKAGQSVWLDNIRRSLLVYGGLERLIDDDGIKGVTSNPAIFEKAIAGSNDYIETIRELAKRADKDAESVYEQIAVDDIQYAADILHPVYHETQGRDGYVSLEVSPRLAHNSEATIAAARHLWRTVERENLMIKVPATEAGLAAVEILLGEGINVNVTLLFSRKVYAQVVEAFLRGLERLQKSGGDLSKVASVASLFVSRIDNAVDQLLDEKIESATGVEDISRLQTLKGRAAVANARLAYQHYKVMFSGSRWQSLAAHGASSQRLLWASTGTKNPAYSDVLYIESLIGPDTVNTVPPATLDAFRDHGSAQAHLEDNLEQAQTDLAALEAEGISLDEVTDSLLKEGLDKFVEAYEKLLKAVEQALQGARLPKSASQTSQLPDALQQAVNLALDDWTDNNKASRLWARDASLWTGDDENRWLDWLDIAEDQFEHLGDLRRLGHFSEGHYFTDVLLLGMGGSSLAPEVFSNVFGEQPDHPRLHVLDSTDPAQIRHIESSINLQRTGVIVASKSGSTLEPNILMAYFFNRIHEEIGDKQAALHFVAITDPGSELEKFATMAGFRRVYHGRPGIGGRYSALSNFGLVPAAFSGVDVSKLLNSTLEMVEACAPCVPVRENPGVLLGVVLGQAALQGRDKLTLILSPAIAALGAWLEQLLAESTGKQGKGIIPVVDELPLVPQACGDDRLFVYLRLEGDADPQQDSIIEVLQNAGQAVVRIAVTDIYDLGQEMFRWQFATAVAGSEIGINAFNQPDVEASKIATRNLMAAYENSGALPEQTPLAAYSHLSLYADAKNTEALRAVVGEQATLADWLGAHLQRIQPGDYFALLAYLNRLDDRYESTLQDIRHQLRDHYQVATCLGFGPRFLHSTGQAYKGGPNSGVFLQLTCDDADIPVPGYGYSFGVVKTAQAEGDFQVLAERRDRRALRIHLHTDTEAALVQLSELIRSELAARSR